MSLLANMVMRLHSLGDTTWQRTRTHCHYHRRILLAIALLIRLRLRLRIMLHMRYRIRLGEAPGTMVAISHRRLESGVGTELRSSCQERTGETSLGSGDYIWGLGKTCLYMPNATRTGLADCTVPQGQMIHLCIPEKDTRNEKPVLNPWRG